MQTAKTLYRVIQNHSTEISIKKMNFEKTEYKQSSTCDSCEYHHIELRVLKPFHLDDEVGISFEQDSIQIHTVNA